MCWRVSVTLYGALVVTLDMSRPLINCRIIIIIIIIIKTGHSVATFWALGHRESETPQYGRL